MKNLFALIILFLSLNSFGSVAFTVEGELQVNTGDDRELASMILISGEHEVKIVDFEYKASAGCKQGLFEIVNNFYPEDTYSIVDVYACLQKEELNNQNCEEIYQPVCGRRDPSEIDQTYQNYCTLYKAQATFKSLGECTD